MAGALHGVRVLDLSLALGRVLLDEVLMNREADRSNAIVKSVALEFLQIGPVRRCEWLLLRDIHLPVENVQAFDANPGGFLDDSLDRHLFCFEMPIGVSGDAKFNALLAGG